jgi:hypothetical protein
MRIDGSSSGFSLSLLPEVEASVNLFLASITFSYLELKQNQRQEEAIEDAHRILVAILMNPTDGKAKLNAESTIESALGNGQGSDEEYEKDTFDELF